LIQSEILQIIGGIHLGNVAKFEKKEETVFRKKKSHKKIFALILVVVLLLVGVFGISQYLQAKKASMRNNFIGQTVKIEKRNLANSISETGTVEANNTVNEQSTLTNVKITGVSVKVGDRVNQGDTICTLDVSNVKDSLATTQKSISAGEKTNNISAQSAQRAVNYAKANQSAQAAQADSEVTDAANNLTNAQNNQTTLQNQLAAAKTALQSAQDANNASNQQFQPVQNDYNTKQAAYETAKAASDASQANVDAIQTQISSTTDAAKLTTLNSQLDAAKADLAQKLQTTSATQAAVNAAQAGYDSAKAAADATTGAYTTAKASEASLESQVSAAATAVNTAQAQYNTNVNNKDTTNRTNQNTVSTQEDNLKTAQINNSTSLDTKQDQLKQYDQQMAEGNVTAQISGVVTAINVTAGNNYTGGTIVAIEDDSAYIVDTTVDDYDIGNITLNMPVVIKTNGTGDTELNGTITYVSPKPEGSTTASTTSATTSSSATSSSSSSSSSSGVNYEVKVGVNTANSKLKLGMTAQLSIVSESKQNVLAVPYNAVTKTDTGKGTITVIDTKTKKLQKIDVTTGMETDYYIEISGNQIEQGMSVVLPSTSTNAASTVKRMGPLGGL